MNIINNFKVVVVGGVVATLMLILGYVIFTQVNVTPTTTTEYLSGSIYVTLKRFKNENVNFGNMKNLVDDTFNELVNTRVEIQTGAQTGRSNPFSP